MVKKFELILVFLLALLIIPVAYAADGSISVDKTDKGSVIIAELDNPAVYNFQITNTGPMQTAEFFSLVGLTLSPRGAFDLPSGVTNVEVKAYPTANARKRTGLYSFEYQIKGSETGLYKDTLLIEVVELQDALHITLDNILPEDTSTTVTVKNLKNTNLDNVQLHMVSSFFDSNINVSLAPYEEAKVPLTVNTNKAKTLLAGPYVVLAEVDFNGAKTKIDSVINYLEKEGISVNKQTSGWIIRENSVTKTNEGNNKATATIEVKKDILSRLFTVMSLEPTQTQRGGLFVSYVWSKELGPSESLSVKVTTNYTVPFVLILLIVVLAFLVWVYTRTSIVVTKKASFVRTRGGEFALKVRVHVRARKHVERVQVIDLLPSGTKLYEKYGTKPDKLDEQTRRLFWNISNMNSGEERIYSYIIYSKLKIVGTVALPTASVIFERNGETHEVISNRAFFSSEMSKSE